jgi:hypothetical protein
LSSYIHLLHSWDYLCAPPCLNLIYSFVCVCVCVLIQLEYHGNTSFTEWVSKQIILFFYWIVGKY